MSSNHLTQATANLRLPEMDICQEITILIELEDIRAGKNLRNASITIFILISQPSSRVNLHPLETFI